MGTAMWETYKHRDRLTCMAGMMAAMSLGMMAGIALGYLLAVLLDKNLTLSTMFAVVLAAAIGYGTGRWVTLMAALDGMMAGIMGGMMGAMLGAMIFDPAPMAAFVSLLVVATVYVVVRMIREESGVASEEKPASRVAWGMRMTLVGLAVLVGLLLVAEAGLVPMESQASRPAQPAPFGTPAASTPPTQVATIRVAATGYEPETITLQAGEPTALHFQTEEGAGCLRQVVSPELGLNLILEVGDNVVNLPALKPGTYRYTCGMNMYSGAISVL